MMTSNQASELPSARPTLQRVGRDFSPNAGWTSYHLFYDGSDDQLLTRLVLPFVRDSWRRHLIIRFFFIHYGLGGAHLRLRLLGMPEHREEIDRSLRNAAAEFFRHWPSERRLPEDAIRRRNKKFSAHDATCPVDAVYPNDSVAELPFHAEVERYGGPALVAHSLDFFCISSASVLRLVERHQDEPRPRRLFRAMQLLLRQALGLAADRERLSRLVAYTAVGNGPGSALLIARADEEFERCREAYIALVREEIENSRDPAVRARCAGCQLTNAARVLRWQIREATDAVWWQIASSHLHMTSNRMGLNNVEEIYLGQILRRALAGAADASSGGLPPLGSSLMEPGIAGEGRLAALAAASLAQLAPREIEDER